MQGSVGELLHEGAARLTDSGSETPRLDAEVLLGHVLHVDRATLLAGPEAGVGAEAAGRFTELVERRTTGEPVAYIRGLKEFYGIVFSVDPRVMIPRPETETLVELAIARVAGMLTGAPREAGDFLRIWDVGTGSGAIVVSIAVESRRRGYARDIRLSASDISAQALALAVENAVVHGVADMIEFAAADLTAGAGFGPVDLLVANLPYIRRDAIPTLPAAATFEPVIALDGGPDGLDLVRALIDQLPVALGRGGTALLEIGADQADAVSDLAGGLGDGWSSVVHDDLAGRPRVAEITRAAA